MNNWNGKPYHSLDYMLRERFGEKVYKVTLNGGMSCPNRDGTIGSEGCTFCDNRAFTPSYCSPRKSLTRQIDEGIAFHAARGRDEGLCLVYFQPFSNTHAPVARLRELYAEALAHPRISGLVTRSWICWRSWHGNAMWRSNTASNPPATKHCGPSVAAMTSRRPGRLLRRAPHGGCTSGPISFWGCPAKTTKCFFDRWSGSMPCRSKRSSSTSCSSFGERPLPRNTTPSPAASACVPPRSISRWWSRCCGGCVPIWLWSVSPAKCRWDFTT